MTNPNQEDRVVVAYTAGSLTEAVVIRGLLASNGIASPDPTSAEPFPLSEPAEGNLGTEVYTLESQADEARRIIESYGKGAASAAAAE